MSLRWRLVLSYALVIAVCLGIVGIVFAAAARTYGDRIATEQLKSVSLPIYVEARSLSARGASVRDIWTNLETQAQESNVGVLLVDASGQVTRAASPFIGLGIRQLELPDDVIAASAITSGTWRAPGGQSFVYVVYPLAQLSLSSASMSQPELLVLASPRRGLLATWGVFLRPLIWAGLIAFVLSVVLALAIARSFYRPIRVVTEASGRMAAGEFDQTVPVRGPPELRELSAAFNHMALQVRVSQQRVRDFVADVSHELKSPLTSIGGFAQALLDGTAHTGDMRERAARIILDQSNRVTAQVDELLELSRMQSGQFELAREDVSLADLVGSLLEAYSQRATQCNVALESRLPTDMHVVADPRRLRMVFDNLVDNGLKHSPAGGTVTVSGSVGKKWATVIVTDEGRGIAPDMVERVFERFYQGTGVRTGSGLGLAITKEIVMAHGGTICASNRPGGGAEFTVRLPLADSGAPPPGNRTKRV